MKLLELGVLYAIGGAVSAIIVSRRDRERTNLRWLNLMLALLLWPLWLPVSLSREQSPTEEQSKGATASEQALYQGYEAVKGTPLEKLLPRESVERIALELRRVVERDRELSRLLCQPSFSLPIARARIDEMAQNGGSARAISVAQRHVENIERLAALHARDQLLLSELGDWLTTLRTQLVLARYSASSAEGVGDIFAEVCARVEVLSTTLEEPPLTLPEPPNLSWPNTFS